MQASLRLPLPYPGFQSKTLAELEDIFTETAEAQELASGIGMLLEPASGSGPSCRQWERKPASLVS